MTYDISALLKLPPAERLEIIGVLWDSVDAQHVSTPDWHIEELERREEFYKKHPTPTIPWEDIRKRFEKH